MGREERAIMVRWVRVSKPVSVNHLSGHIIFDPQSVVNLGLFSWAENREQSGPLYFIELWSKSVHHLSMYIQYWRSTRFCHRLLFNGRCSERCSVESSTLAIRVVVFFVQVRAPKLQYCSLSIISVWNQLTILDHRFLFWEYISQVIRGRWVEYESFGTVSVSSLL